MKPNPSRSEHGITLVEVIVAMAVTLIVMGGVYGLLQKANRSFRREPEVTAQRARDLGFARATKNSLDAVSDRDLERAFPL